MKRFLSVLLSAFLFLSGASPAFAFEYDFSTDFEKFSSEVTELISDYESFSENESELSMSDSPKLYYSASDGTHIETNEENVEYTNRMIVKSSEEIDILDAVACVKGFGDLYVLQFASSEDFIEAYSFYNTLESVDFVQEDSYCSIEETTEAVTEVLTEDEAETAFNPTQTQADIFGFTALRQNLEDNLITYSDDIVVGVVDSGIANDHPLLSEKVIPTGFNSIDEADDCYDDNGHGTHVAGIIAANSLDNVYIKPYKVLNEKGQGTELQVYLGIMQAVIDEVDIINLSLSCRGNSQILHEAVVEADNNGIIVVASAGNKGVSLANVSYSPACFTEVITVGACDDDFEPCSFSNYGGSTDIFAPGKNINSCSVDGGYVVKSGTSMSAPFVTAAVSYIVLQFPDYTYSDICGILFNYGKPCRNSVGGRYLIATNITEELQPSVTPIFSTTKMLFSSPFELSITCEDSDAEIYYRTSLMKDNEYRLYTEPIYVGHDLSVSAFTVSDGNEQSAVSTYTYTRKAPTDTSVYTVDANGILTAYTGDETDIVVPATVSGKYVYGVESDVFQGRDDIRSVSFSGYTTSLSDDCFSGCDNLEFVRINGATTIGDNAFKDCKNLVSVATNNLTSVGDYAFYNCEKLSVVKIGKINSVGVSAFENTPLLAGLGSNSFVHISDRAFYNSGITDANLIVATKIGNEAFYNCSKLEIVSANRVTEIGEDAFFGCDKITELSLDSITAFDGEIFENNAVLESVSADSLFSIPDNAFKDCTALCEISFASAQTIGDYAFYNTSVGEVVFDNVTSLGVSAFADCPNLTKVILNKLISIGDNAFSGCSSLIEVSFDSVEQFDINMLLGAPTIESIVLSKAKSIIVDENNTFLGLNAYFPEISVFYAPFLTKIPENMFKDCKNISELVFTKLKYVGDYAFYDSSISIIDLSNAVEIGEYAFYNCDNFTEIVLPKATYVGDYAFSNCDNITSFEADLLYNFDFNILDGSTALLETLSVDGVTEITKSGSYTFLYSQFPELVNFSARSLTSLPDSAFENCSKLRTVDLYSAQTLGNKAFKNSGVSDIIAPSALRIGEECFKGCIRLTKLSFDSVTNIAEYAFHGCSNITEFSAGAIDEFDLNILYGCVKLKSLSINGSKRLTGLEFSDINTLENLWPLLNSFSANSLTELPQYLLYEFKNIQNVSFNNATEIPEFTLKGSGIVNAEFAAAKSVSDYAFKDCTALETIKLDKVTSVGVDIFNGCQSVKSLSMNKIKEFPVFDDYKYNFENWNSLEYVSMDSLEVIPNRMFCNCSALERVSLDSVTDIGESAFSYSAISNTSFGSLERIGKKAFSNCKKLKTFDFYYLESIGDYAFEYTGLTEVIMNSPTELGNGVFQNCSSIKEFDFYNMPNLSPDSLFGSSSYYWSGNVKTFSWGGVKEVPEAFFKNAKYLEKVVLYDAEVVGVRAFENCTALTTVDIPNLKTVRAYGFYNCSSFSVGANISDTVEELGAFSITKTKATGGTAFSGLSFDKLKIAHENAFSDIVFSYVKFPVIEEIYDLPDTLRYILIGSKVNAIDFCDDISSKVIAVEGTPVLEYSDEYNLGWLPYDSENAVSYESVDACTFKNFYENGDLRLDFEIIYFDKPVYEWYSASKADFSDAKPFDVNDLIVCDDTFIYCVATTTENGNVYEFRSDVCVVLDNAIKCSETEAYTYGYIFTERTECVDEFDIVSANEGIELKVSPSFDSGSSRGFGTGSEISIYHNDKEIYTFVEVMEGDINGDGVVDVIDAANLNRMYLDYEYDYDDYVGLAADINMDAELNTDDYQLIVNKVLAK